MNCNNWNSPNNVNLFLQESDVFYIPTSGLSGENLTTRSSVSELTSWFSGPSLLEQIGNKQTTKELHVC